MKPRIDRKNKIKIIGINLTLFLLLYGLVYINKTIFRPTFTDTPLAQILTGSFPSFIAAFIISLFIVNPVLIRKPRLSRLIVYLGSVIVMTVLILDEFESIRASMHFDIYDIIATILGSILAVLIYELLHHKQSHGN